MSHPQGKMWLWWNFSMLFLYFRLVRLLHHWLMRLGCLYCRFLSKLSKNIWKSIKNKSAGNEATCRLFRGFFFLFYHALMAVPSALKLQSQPKVVGTLELDHVSPIPPNQCWKISRFFQQKGKKSPDYQHCKWGEGRTCLVSQLFCPGL